MPLSIIFLLKEFVQQIEYIFFSHKIQCTAEAKVLLPETKTYWTKISYKFTNKNISVV